MLLAMLVLLDSILQMQLFQINQSEDSSKVTIMSDTTCGQLHQRPITTASLYESNIERTHNSKAVHCIHCIRCMWPEASLPNCDCLIYLLCFNESTKCFLLLIDTISSADLQLQFILLHQHQPSKKSEIGQCKL